MFNFDFIKKNFSPEDPSKLLKMGNLPPTVQQQMKAVDHYPLSSILPYEYYDAEKQLFFNEDTYGFIIEVAPMPGIDEEQTQILNALIATRYPSGANLQICRYASPDIFNALRKWANLGQDKVEELDEVDDELRNINILNVLNRKRVEHLMKGNWQSLIDNEPVIIRDYRVFICYTEPLPKHDITEVEAENMRRYKRSIMSNIDSLEIPSALMNDTDFLNLMDVILNPYNTKRESLDLQWDQPLREQMVDGETLLAVGRDNLALQTLEKTIDFRTYSVKNFPKMWAPWLGGDLNGSDKDKNVQITCPSLTTLNIHYISQSKAESEANQNALRATQMADGPMGRFLPDWAKKRDEWNFVAGKLDQGSTMVKINYKVALFSLAGEGDHAEQQLMSVYGKLGWKLNRDRFTMVYNFLHSLPMTMGPQRVKELRIMRQTRTMLSWNTACIAPMAGEWKGTGTPFLSTVSKRGQLLNIDPWDNNEGNYNLAIAGASGSGKSFVAQELVRRVLALFGRVWVFDRGRSFFNLCNLLGGVHLDFHHSNDICLNPFTYVKAWEGDEETGSEKIMIRDILIQMLSDRGEVVSGTQAGWLEQALEVVWNDFHQGAEITHIYQYFKCIGRYAEREKETDQRKLDLADALYPFTMEGSYGKYFSGPANVNIDHTFVVIEMKELDDSPHLQSVVMLLIIMRISQTLYGSPRSIRKMCMIDEAWKLMKSGSAAQFIEEGARTFRKYNGSLVTITQGVNDFYKSKTAQAALESSDSMILLRQNKDVLDQLGKANKLRGMESSVDQLKALKTIHGKYSEIAYIYPGGMNISRFIVDKFSEKLYSTKGQEYEFIQRQLESGETLEDAIDNLIEQEKSVA
jgi:conjugal transfer ATP-binding protein TraC